MVAGVLTVLGGVGLFLYAIKVLTEALRDVAGPGLRAAVARFTTTPLRGVATGLSMTAVLQSSAATLVMALGLVGSGLMSFPQTLGVIYGSNIGATLMAWIVAGLGVRIAPDLLALPVLFVASLTLLLGRGGLARAARAVCAAALLFVAVAIMQQGLAGTERLLTPGLLPLAGTAGGQVGLFLVGLAITLVIQSSTVGSAMLVVLLADGEIVTAQAAALLLGMSVGSSSTVLIASVGGSTEMRQAAWANAGFNLGTALLFLPVLGPVVAALDGIAQGDAPVALALFNTLHNVAGAAVFLVLTAPYARLIERLVPDRPEGLARGLDAALLSDPEAALATAAAVARRIGNAAFEAVAAAVGPEGDAEALAALPDRAEPALAALAAYLDRLRPPEGLPGAQTRYAALLHQTDHLSRLVNRSRRSRSLTSVRADPILRRSGCLLAAALRRAASGDAPAVAAARLARIGDLLELRARRHRRAVLLGEHAGLVSVADLFARTDAMRWVEHAAEHAARIAAYRLRAAGTQA